MTEDTFTKPARKITPRAGLIAAALLAVGIGGGATVAKMTAPSIEMAPIKPVAIRSLTDSGSIVTVRGKVAESYGPMFILADGTGRTLVEGGRLTDGTGLISVGQTVSVQGRFDRSMLHASFLVGADGKVTALRPMPPHGGPGGPRGPHGRGGPDGPAAPGGPDGPDGRDVAPPPPPAVAPGAATGTAQTGTAGVAPVAPPVVAPTTTAKTTG